ncbi:MAG: ATP-binding protein [Bradyrhizobium sp.]|nr:MAG: ATP-binding protein [Bradyrhizobium sp.]
MWFKVEGKRGSTGQKFIVRCGSPASGESVIEDRPVIGAAAARKAAEMVATSLNVTATVYGADAAGEFVYGVFEVSDGAGESSSPSIKQMFAESAAASLAIKDQLIAEIPEDSIRGFASLAASLGYFANRHKQVKRSSAPRIGYATLFRIFCGEGEPGVLSLPANDATLALLSRKLSETPGWLWLSELAGVGMADQQAINPRQAPGKVVLNIDGALQVLRPRTVFRGVVPGSGHQFMLILQGSHRSEPPQGFALDSVGLVYREADETEVVALTRSLLQESDAFKNRIVLVNRDFRTVRSKISDRSWADVIPNERTRDELDFIAASIRNRQALKAEGLTIKRGLLLSGPPGDGKSTAIECFANGIAGEATIIFVEAVDHIRAIYQLAQSLAPTVVILEDLDLMTKSRQNPGLPTVRDDVTGELLQVLSGTTAYPDVITIATTNHVEAIDQALSKRAGRFDAHVRMGYPTDDEKQRILELYFDRFRVDDKLTRRRLHIVLAKEFSRLQLVPAHIEEFVKAGVKRARLASRQPEYADFEPGIEATKSIALPKPAAHAGAALAEALTLLQKLEQGEKPPSNIPSNWQELVRPAMLKQP